MQIWAGKQSNRGKRPTYKWKRTAVYCRIEVSGVRKHQQLMPITAKSKPHISRLSWKLLEKLTTDLLKSCILKNCLLDKLVLCNSIDFNLWTPELLGKCIKDRKKTGLLTIGFLITGLLENWSQDQKFRRKRARSVVKNYNLVELCYKKISCLLVNYSISLKCLWGPCSAM